MRRRSASPGRNSSTQSASAGTESIVEDLVTAGHIKTEDEHRRDICTVGRWVYARNFVAATDGNISIRLDSSANPDVSHRRSAKA